MRPHVHRQYSLFAVAAATIAAGGVARASSSSSSSSPGVGSTAAAFVPHAPRRPDAPNAHLARRCPPHPTAFASASASLLAVPGGAREEDYDDDDDDDEPPAQHPIQPGQNWLRNLQEQASSGDLSTDAAGSGESAEPEERSADVAVPTTGVSVSDSMVDASREQFATDLSPVRGVPGAAVITTESGGGSDEPARYLVALSPPPDRGTDNKAEDKDGAGGAAASGGGGRYALIDVPPYSDALAAQIRSFMGGPSSSLCSILITSRDAIHYDESPAVYVTRKSDLMKWRATFPSAEVACYRLDVPRDCRELITQTLDGEGPWALDEDEIEGAGGARNATFFETGRPLTYEVWDEDTARSVLDGGDNPDEQNNDETEEEPADAHLYTPAAIREREENRRVLAVYTPGRTFGSVSYVFPATGVVASGFSIPVEDKRTKENLGGAGPNLDYRGYVTTGAAGTTRQIEGASGLVETYGDRFAAVLPSRGDPVVLGGDAEERRRVLRGVLAQYDEIGRIYEQLGITS